MKKVAIVVQARMNSSRLPGKVLMPFFEGKGILDLLLARIVIRFPDLTLVLATSTNAENEVLESIAVQNKFSFFKGTENNVLKRFIQVATAFDVTHIVRICADNPFLNMEAIERLLSEDPLLESDYVSFCNYKGVPAIKTHAGIYAELVSVSALKEIENYTNDPVYMEHVTNFLYTHPERFKLHFIKMHDALFSREDIRLTIDDLNDFNMAVDIYKTLHQDLNNIDGLVSWIENSKQSREIMVRNILNYSK